MTKTLNKKTLAIKLLGPLGYMVSSSKGKYNFDNPKNLVIFNSNICTSEGKFWYGDVDVTLNQEELVELATTLKEDIFVLYEMDARFEKEETPDLSKFVVMVTKDGGMVISNSLKDYVFIDENDTVVCKEINKEEKEYPDHYNHENYKEEEFTLIGEFNDSSLKTNKKINPLDALDKYLFDLLTVMEFNIRDLSISNVYWTKESEDQFIELTKNWLIKHQDLVEGSYELMAELTWVPLATPNIFRESKYGPTWVKRGGIYVTK